MGLFDGLGDKIGEVFSPVGDFFAFFKLFMLKVEIFFVNFAFVLLFFLFAIMVLAFVTFPFWFPALMKRYGSTNIGKFLSNSIANLVKFFF